MGDYSTDRNTVFHLDRRACASGDGRITWLDPLGNFGSLRYCRNGGRRLAVQGMVRQDRTMNPPCKEGTHAPNLEQPCRGRTFYARDPMGRNPLHQGYLGRAFLLDTLVVIQGRRHSTRSLRCGCSNTNPGQRCYWASRQLLLARHTTHSRTRHLDCDRDKIGAWTRSGNFLASEPNLAHCHVCRAILPCALERDSHHHQVPLRPMGSHVLRTVHRRIRRNCRVRQQPLARPVARNAHQRHQKVTSVSIRKRSFAFWRIPILFGNKFTNRALPSSPQV